jgi:hypothetical protein
MPRFMGTLLLAVVSTLAALTVAELGVRALGLAPGVKAIWISDESHAYKRSSNPIMGFELKANYRNDNPDFIQSYPSTNSHGQRDVERSLEKPPGVRRILLLGDSVVEGIGIRDLDDTISRQLEGLYPDGRTEVLNFGVSSYCTKAEVALLEEKGLEFRPDVVVLIFVRRHRRAPRRGKAPLRPLGSLSLDVDPPESLSLRRRERSGDLEPEGGGQQQRGRRPGAAPRAVGGARIRDLAGRLARIPWWWNAWRA